MGKIIITEGQLKKVISAIKKDKNKEIFDYNSLTSNAWFELVNDAKKIQKIAFDLENDESTGEKKTFYVKKDLRKGQPVKYEFNAELMIAGGDWEMAVMYFRLEFTRDYFDNTIKSDSPKYAWEQSTRYDRKLYKCYVVIPPVEAGNKLQKIDDDPKYEWGAYDNDELTDEQQKSVRITDSDKLSAWKWLEELLANLVEKHHKMLD